MGGCAAGGSACGGGSSWCWRRPAGRVWASAYKVQDIGVFFLPAFLLTALWAAMGVAPLFDAMTRYPVHGGAAAAAARLARPCPPGGPGVAQAVIVLFQPVQHARTHLPEATAGGLGSAMITGRTWSTRCAARQGDRSVGGDDPGSLFSRHAGATDRLRRARRRRGGAFCGRGSGAGRRARCSTSPRLAGRGGTLQPGRGRPVDRRLGRGGARARARGEAGGGRHHPDRARVHSCQNTHRARSSA